MTVLIKAKGYINNNERGANKTLLSYSQLAALTSADAVDEELNADPTRYYNALDGDSHIGTIDGNDYIVDGQGNKTVWSQSGGTLADGNYAFYFGDGIWEAEGQAPSLLTYEEIVAAAGNEGSPYPNLITELNSNAQDYYDALDAGGNLIEQCFADDPYEGYAISGIGGNDPNGQRKIAWNNGTWVAVSNGPC